MLDFLQGNDLNSRWLQHGGRETLASYGISADQVDAPRRNRLLAEAYIPSEHLELLETLPIALETSAYFFAHAGARPGVPLAMQSDDDLLWFKDGMQARYEEFEKVVVHGHDALARAHVGTRRINVDTGAFATGCL